MSVNGGGARLQPNTWRCPCLSDGVAYKLGGFQARLGNNSAVLRCVATVYALPGEINHRVRTLKFLNPTAQRRSIPLSRPPWIFVGTAAKHYDFMLSLMKSARQHVAQLTRSTGDYNLHKAPISTFRPPPAPNHATPTPASMHAFAPAASADCSPAKSAYRASPQFDQLIDRCAHVWAMNRESRKE